MGPQMTDIAKLFRNGRSQAVRLPAQYRFSGDEVFVRRQGKDVVLSPRPVGWGDFFARHGSVPADFLADRQDLPLQARDKL
jgi:antitoxin VapB